VTRPILFAALFRHREALLLLLGAPIATFALRGEGLAPWSALAGVAIAAAGVALRLAAVRRIGRGARVFRPHASAGLIAAGPYRWSRNPLYLAAALMLCGLGLIAGAGWLAAALLPATLVAYTPVVMAEERALAELCGVDYARYLERVPRWLGGPAAADLGPSQGARVGWSEVFRREKMLVPGTAAAMLAIAALREQWIPSRLLVDRLERGWGVDLAWWIAGLAAMVVLGNAIKVERHQRRRRARREVRAAVVC
jgi:protein-S-isoprenylcysteine O-methyltransferase Ste14